MDDHRKLEQARFADRLGYLAGALLVLRAGSGAGFWCLVGVTTAVKKAWHNEFIKCGWLVLQEGIANCDLEAEHGHAQLHSSQLQVMLHCALPFLIHAATLPG